MNSAFLFQILLYGPLIYREANGGGHDRTMDGPAGISSVDERFSPRALGFCLKMFTGS